MPPQQENKGGGLSSLAAVDSPTMTDAVLKDNVIQVDDKLYDVKKLSNYHPGGELFVKSFAGRDATEAFLSYHRRKFPHAKLTDMHVGNKAPGKDDPNSDKEFLELCALVEQILPRNKSFAPWHYYLKVAVILGSAFSLEYYIHSTGQYKWYLTGLLGWIFSLIGLNIQHDANHGSISRYPIVNRVLGMSQNWIGGSAVHWIHQHVVQHHVHCNDVEKDPDIVGNDLLRFNPLTPLKKIHGFQYLYLFSLLAAFGFTYIVDGVRHNLQGFHKTKYSTYLASNRIFEFLTSVSFFVRWFGIPFFTKAADTSILSTYLNIAPMFLVGGYYLSFFFVMSHNFEGVYQFGSAYMEKEGQNFLRRQVASSSNVCYDWLCFFNGGLNYQIEHHLFPRVQHSHYPKIAPVVAAFCKSRNIPYVHFPTVADNVKSLMNHMIQMGEKKSPSNYKE